MAIALELADALQGDGGKRPWVHLAAIESCWGFIPLYWEALHIELHGTPAVERFPASLPPYTSAGQDAMVALLHVEATYVDAVDDGKEPKFPHLLMAGQDLYRAVPSSPQDEWNSDWTGSSLNLADETQQIAEILIAAGWAGSDGAEKSASLPYDQAIALHRAAARSCTEHRALRLRFVPQPRPHDAPILPYTAHVEGFDSIAAVAVSADSLVITLASLYEYSVSRGFICEFERLREDVRLLTVTVLYGGAALGGVMEDGSSFEWQWSTVLKVCEPAFAEFGDLEMPRRRILDRWRGAGALRRVRSGV
jgi:hypothetical protein